VATPTTARTPRSATTAVSEDHSREPTAPGSATTAVSEDRSRKPTAPLRRVPVQGRSVARVARMLDACAELVDEVGYDGLTTTVLAERAGVAIGSVYQFFPDKRAIVQALTLRNLEAYLDRLGERIAQARFAHWWDAVDAAIDEYIAMHRDVPGFRTLHFGDVVDIHLLDEERDNNSVIVEHLAALLVRQFDLPPGERLDFALLIAVEVGDALIKMAFRRSADGDPAVLDETKGLIREYLHRRVQ
jgi:AcrR family transcriptional regulator